MGDAHAEVPTDSGRGVVEFMTDRLVRPAFAGVCQEGIAKLTGSGTSLK
jgi:hypothetical protein